MMRPHTVFADGTQVVHSRIVTQDGVGKVLVHFERPTERGFDSARCELPSYAWTEWEGGFADAERSRFERFLKENARDLYRRAAN